MTLHVIQEYDLRITALEAERDRLLAYLRDIKTCLNTGNRLDLYNTQRIISSAITIADLALKGEK